MFFSSHYRQVKLCQRNVLPLLGLAFENHQTTPLWAWNSTEKPKMLQAVCGVRALHREHPACATLHGLLGLNAHQKVTGFSQRSKLPAFTMLWVDATDFLILIDPKSEDCVQHWHVQGDEKCSYSRIYTHLYMHVLCAVQIITNIKGQAGSKRKFKN